jgi:DNA polymerase-3 subunit alpha
MSKFTHFHVHTHYSVLDGAAKVKDLIKRAKELEMDALAITDHGNMFGVMEFVQEATEAGIKPIIGVETYIARNGVENKSGKEDRSGYHLILLAKNFEGYRNLIKLVSRSYIDGFYYTPRMDKSWLKQHSEGIIASSACLGGEIAQMILKNNLEDAETALRSYLDIFKDNFYLELMNHGYDEQATVNRVLFEMAKKHNVKLIATNDVHFIHHDDYEAHKLLISINTGKDSMEDALHYTGNEYLKSYEEMQTLFSENPEVLQNTVDLANSIETIDLEKKAIMPNFPIPEEFESDDDYLRHLSYEGARKKYEELNDEISSRLDFELSVIKNMKYAGYFLIVQDLIAIAKQKGVLVGPGRGSAAGSLIAYAIDITNVDPLKYKLLFERFLNPERVSMPDIDIDFDDEGRESVFQYVVDKYGQDKVAQIVTFGTLGSRSAIRDVARIMGAELSIADKLAKLIPEGQGVSILDAIEKSPEFKKIFEQGSDLEKKIIENAKKLEGTIRQTGVHACGAIIGRYPLEETIPLALPKGATMPVSQYEGHVVEEAGLLKMDFLGLKTLSIMKETVNNIKKRHKIQIQIDDIPIDDAETMKLFQKGETVGIFQFESAGMRKWLKELQPTTIDDLIAMNALFRPGPMQFIQKYIDCKQNKIPVTYPHPLLEPILKDTYGIMVYQEQIMEAGKILAGFTLGGADILRRAMGKKLPEEMRQQKALFLKGAKELNGIDEKQASKIFDLIQEFAKYGFNKSHSAAYSVLAMQTAWLKTHYSPEYMAALLTHNLSDLKKITTFIDDAKHMDIQVLGPDINESDHNFTVTKSGKIRFGLSAIKNVGEAASISIIEEREQNGKYESIEDFLKRLHAKNVNKRCIEALAYAGGFDSFDIHRAQFFHKMSDNTVFIDVMLKHATYLKTSALSNQPSLFGTTEETALPQLQFPVCEPFSKFEELKYEKEMTGFYINSHPLDEYKFEIDHFCSIKIIDLKELNAHQNKIVSFAGMIVDSKEKITKNNKKYGTFIIEDETESYTINIFNETYLKFKHFLDIGTFVLCSAMVKKQYNGERLEINILSIELLADISDKISGAELMIPLETLHEVADIIVSAVKNCKGRIPVKFSVFEQSNSNGKTFGCKLINPNHKVNREFLSLVNTFENCKLVVNKNNGV